MGQPRGRRGIARAGQVPVRTGRVHVAPWHEARDQLRASAHDGHVGPLDIVTVAGFRCSSATRTILDLAHLGVPPIRLAAAIDSARHSGLSATRVIEERLGALRGRGRYGVRQLDRLLPDSGGETPLERAFLAVLRRNGLPRPTTQLRVTGSNGLIGRVDFCYSDFRIVIEVTGRKGHASDAERQHDAQRRNELTDRGLKVYEYTRGDIDDRPEWVASTMRVRLVAAGWSGIRVRVR